jgi:hypothetical protein
MKGSMQTEKAPSPSNASQPPSSRDGMRLWPRFRTHRAKLAVLGVALAVGGCSILQTVYHQAPKYLLWRTNIAFQYDDVQHELARQHLRQWFDWQRKQQMPQIAKFLHRAQTEVLGQVSPALACERREETERWLRDGLDQAAPRVAQVVLTLKPSQIGHLEAFFKDKNDDFTDDFVSDDPKERARLAAKFVVKWSSIIYGDFSDAQRDQLQADIARLPFDSATMLAQFQRFQVGYVKLLREATSQHWSQEQTQARIKALVLDGIDPKDPARHAEMQRWIKAGCQLGADFHSRTTPAQRTKAAEQFRTWEIDATELSQED